MVYFNLFFSLKLLVCGLLARFLVCLFVNFLFVPLCAFAVEKK